MRTRRPQDIRSQAEAFARSPAWTVRSKGGQTPHDDSQLALEPQPLDSLERDVPDDSQPVKEDRAVATAWCARILFPRLRRSSSKAAIHASKSGSDLNAAVSLRCGFSG